ncbi:hypothetical protein P8452_05565 [Trifolium repens]|nr:hypothetical protein P8452_05565 [Trifolium repens]
MATPSTTNKLTLKLLIDRKNDKVLFAEASKAVVDFLFSLLCLPIGTVVKLLGNNDMVGSIGNLYNSVENLNHNYIQPDQTKDVFLNPSAPVWSVHISSCLLPMQEGILNTSSGFSSFLVAAELDNEDDEEDMEEELESDFEDDEEEDEMEEDESITVKFSSLKIIPCSKLPTNILEKNKRPVLLFFTYHFSFP